MPLLRRQPFLKEPIPDDLEPDEELFHCKLTNEVFRDYDAFFERVILCNSLVWTCKMTGRPGLTYLEAVTTEEKARDTLSVLTTALKQPILFLARSIRRHRLGDLCDDVCGYMKDRFFVGEDVDAVVNGERRSCRVVKVIAPNNSKHSLTNGNAHDSSDDSDSNESPSAKVILPSRYKYHVRDVEAKGPAHLVTPSDIVRKKGVFTKDRTKLFLKHACELTKGNWITKDKFIKKYNIDELKFSDIFVDPKPNLDANRRESPHSSKRKKDRRRSSSKRHKHKKSSSRDSERKSRHKEVSSEPTREERKHQVEEERRKRKEEKDKEREKQREERRIMAECLREWQKPRDDLECDDLMDLPNAVPITTTVPNDLFGDVLAVIEFLYDFSDLLSVGDHFAYGMTLETMEKALMEKDVQGPLNDILQMLLVAVFNAQEEENEDEAKLSKDDPHFRAAIVAANNPMNMQGVSLRNISLDAFTLSEVLRLHFLSSGVRFRSGYALNRDDPGILFRIEEKDLLQRLSFCSIFDMSPAEKLKILMTLIGQLLACKGVREDVEDNIERLRMARYDIKQLQWAEQRREREEAALRVKMKMDEEAAKGEDDEEPEKNASKSKESFEGEAELDRQEAKRKLEGAKKEKELSELVNKLQNRGVVQPLGRDRAFRRFWMFNSVPGLFVEDDDDTVGPCLPHPTPYNPNSNPYTSFNLSVNEARHRASGGGLDGISDKENAAFERAVQSLNGASLHKSHKLLSDNHPTLNGVVVDSSKPSPRKSRSGTLDDSRLTTVFGMCNGLGDVCPAHGTSYPRTKWSFFPTAADVECLIASLNPRGFREGSLKEVLVAEKKRVLQSVSKCPVARLNRETVVIFSGGGDNKTSRLQTSGPAARSSDTVCEDILNVTLRDSLAEMEEKIYAGGLGCLKVTDRLEWRDRLLGFIQENDEETETMKTRSSHVKNEEMGRHSSKLATCLLEIFDGIEPKYLTPPLGGDGDSTANKSKSLVCRWKGSLAACTSLSQVFVHLATLERSVAWSRSVLNARCRICRRKGDAEHMLLCDECDRGHHIYCLKPALKEIPDGDWLCKDCSPKPKPVQRNKRIKVQEEEDVEEKEEEEEEEEVEEEEVEEDDEVEEEEEEEEEDDEEEEMSDEEEEDEEAEVEREQKATRSTVTSKKDVSYKDRGKGTKKETLCAVCHKSGLLVCCCYCTQSYHLACVRHSQRKTVSRGKWACSDCSQNSTTVSSSRSGAIKRSLKESDERPRRLDRKAKCVTNYSKLSRGDDEDDESDDELSSKRPRRSCRRTDDDITDEEWYGLVRRQTPPSRRGASEDVPLDYKICDQLLTDLVRHEDGWPFLKPVTRKEVADYYDLIKKPVDFGAIRSRLNRMEYRDNKLFVADVMLVFQNCCVFNPAESMEYRAAERLGRFFIHRIRETGLVLLSEEVREQKAIVNGHVTSSSSDDDNEESTYEECNSIIVVDNVDKNDETEDVHDGEIIYKSNVNGVEQTEHGDVCVSLN